MRRFVAKSHTKRCPTGKARFKDHPSARRAVGELQKQGERRGKTIKRCYECPLCSGWHLTSQEER